MRPPRRFPALLFILMLGTASTLRAQADERTLYASVVDKTGAPVLDLTLKDFIIREDGQAREILRVAPDTDPLQIALLVDNSVSMRASITDLRRAVNAFIDNTREGVQIALITFAERPTISVSYTADHAALKKGADRLFATSPDNYLLDGISEASQGLAKRSDGRSVIAVITGVSGDSSYRQYDDALRFLRESGAALHVLTFGAGSGGFERDVVISKGTAETGGRNDRSLSSTGLTQKAQQLASEISHQYRVVYARPQRLIPPKNTEVAVKREDLEARGMLMRIPKATK